MEDSFVPDLYLFPRQALSPSLLSKTHRREEETASNADRLPDAPSVQKLKVELEFDFLMDSNSLVIMPEIFRIADVTCRPLEIRRVGFVCDMFYSCFADRNPHDTNLVRQPVDGFTKRMTWVGKPAWYCGFTLPMNWKKFRIFPCDFAGRIHRKSKGIVFDPVGGHLN